jgi:hypothetical protein
MWFVVHDAGEDHRRRRPARIPVGGADDADDDEEGNQSQETFHAVKQVYQTGV